MSRDIISLTAITPGSYFKLCHFLCITERSLLLKYLFCLGFSLEPRLKLCHFLCITERSLLLKYLFCLGFSLEPRLSFVGGKRLGSRLSWVQIVESMLSCFVCTGIFMVFPFLPFMIHDFFPYLDKTELGKLLPPLPPPPPSLENQTTPF